jgi:hypothetical protein
MLPQEFCPSGSRGRKTMLNSDESEGALRPEDFPVGSVESRAAARAMLERRPTPRFVIGLGDSPRSDAV